MSKAHLDSEADDPRGVGGATDGVCLPAVRLPVTRGRSFNTDKIHPTVSFQRLPYYKVPPPTLAIGKCLNLVGMSHVKSQHCKPLITID